MLLQTARRLFAEFVHTRFATAVISLVALIGVLATIEKCLMANHMIEKFGFEDLTPVLFNASTFYLFAVLSLGCIAAGRARLTQPGAITAALERVVLKSAVLIHICVLTLLLLMLACGFAIVWPQ